MVRDGSSSADRPAADMGEAAMFRLRPTRTSAGQRARRDGVGRHPCPSPQVVGGIILALIQVPGGCVWILGGRGSCRAAAYGSAGASPSPPGPDTANRT